MTLLAENLIPELTFLHLSSRSQCIINISYGPQKIEGDGEEEPQSTVLTIVDLAGAEREKKTGNQVWYMYILLPLV